MNMAYFFTIRKNSIADLATASKLSLLFKAFCYKIDHSNKERSKI